MGKQIAIMEWLAQGRIAAGREHEALKLGGVYPDTMQWRRFIDQLLLWLGVIALGASLIFFLAYNWQALGRYAKFGLVEVAIVLSLLSSWRLGLGTLAGKACLLLATLFLGALLALVGQTYQTGADTYELFLVWALAATAWVFLAQLGAMYLLWLGLINLAIVLYFQTFGGLFGFLFNWNAQLWVLLGWNTLALIVWEFAAWRGVQHLQARWTVRVLATYSGVVISTLALDAIFNGSSAGLSGNSSSRITSVLCYGVWLLAVMWAYRRHLKDLYMLAGAILSLIVVGNAMLAKQLLHHSDAGGFLLIGLTIIASSAAGGIWLKKIAKEMQS
ncbi:DUF2157 domain-containing protein [Undibacterium flavidum]|uniref:DUF2157 domain-containing protein n=1 Tax=Undibacterium flavidum TaxID=2762297 RepID=A0ABR6YC67_9BURK|nr:DUF2157 domain-containing protein [Undibacterium flavidum]MBC3874139.1 DUF2157 domain-containing protein [Undibacterium flavidum]